MSDAKGAAQLAALKSIHPEAPDLVMSIFRGVGQVFFQENAISGICFLVGIAISSPLVAIGGLVGSIIGTLTARLLKFDQAELIAGIFGFNATLVGIATLVFFSPGLGSIAFLIVGCVLSTILTRIMRKFVPFPTYTTPFIVTTWVIFVLGTSMGLAQTSAGGPSTGSSLAVAAANGIGQVMFQANVWTAALFVLGIAIGDWQHALWVVAGSIIGTLLSNYHVTVGARAIDPERLVERALTENIALGLYGYNATLVAVSLSLWRRSLIPPILGILLSVLLTDLFPLVGLPALTAPFVLASWLVIGLGKLEARIFPARTSTPG